MCDKVGILNAIERLPDGFNCQVIDVTSSEILFFLGMARSLLSNPSILMIYELPQDASPDFIYHFRKVIKKLAKEKTIIFFTHSEEFDDIAGLVYEINGGNASVVQKQKIEEVLVSVHEEKPKRKRKTEK